MDKRKDPSVKMRNTFYSPTREEVERCSASHDQKSQRFFREESSIKFQPIIESSRNTTDEILIKGDPAMNQSQIVFSPITFSGNSKGRGSNNRNITPQKLVPRQSQGHHYLPTLVRGSARELEKSMISPSMDKDSTYEAIEDALLKENKTELTKIYKAAREFQDLKLTKEKERLRDTSNRESDRIKAAMTKLSEDHANTLSHNVQGIRTDISHYFNERRSKSPEQTLPEIKDQFKKKFHKLLQDINDDSKLSPGRTNGFSTNRLGSNLLDNNLKSSRFLACETSPARRNIVFTSLHKDIRSVRTPMNKAKQEMEQQINDKSHHSISSGQLPQKSILNHGVDAFDENVLQALKKELPNVFSSNPSNRQEVLVLGNWLIGAIKGVQEDEQLAMKDRFYKADEIYNICFNELIRQVSFDCMERAELMMKIWKAYMSLSQDIIDDFKEREKVVFAKADQEIEKVKKLYQKMLDDKDKEIERIKEMLVQKDDIIRLRNERIDRFNEDQSGNITQAKNATEAYTRIHKMYVSLKQEYKDVNFKFEKIKGRIGAAELEALGKEDYIDSDTSSDEESKGVPMFGTKQQKIIRKENKDTTTEDLMTLMRTGEEAPGISTQTDLALMHKRYNPILKNNGALDDILREKAAKRKLIREGELIKNMRDKSDKELNDKEYMSAQTLTERGRGYMTDRRTSILSHAEEGGVSAKADSKARSIASQSQVLDIVQEKRSFKIKGPNEQQPNQTLHNFNSNKLLSKADMRRDSVMSTRSDRVMRNGEHPPETERSANRDPLAQMTESSETESVINYKETHPEYGKAGGANDNNQKLVLTKTRSGGSSSKVAAKKNNKKVQRNSVREAYFGTSEKHPADLGDNSGQRREDGTTKKLLVGNQQVTVTAKSNNAINSGAGSITKRTTKKKFAEAGETATSAIDNTARAMIEGKRDARREPESFRDITSSSSLVTSNLASAHDDFKSSLRSNFKPKTTLVDKKDTVIEVPELRKSTKNLTVSDHLSSPSAAKPFSLNIQLLSPITMKEFTGDPLTPNAMMDLKAASMRLEDDSPENKSEISSVVSRESRPIRTVVNAIKAIKKVALSKDSDKKMKALNGIAETLAQIEEDNELAAQLMETQEQRIVRFTNLYKIEKRKQEDLRALNRELERQVIQDGVVIENFHRLIEELSQVGSLSEVQKKKLETLVGALTVRAKNLEAIDELKPRLDPAFGGSIVQDIRFASESPRRKLFEDQFTLSSLLPESRYKGDFMVDVVLSPGQKHLLSEKINNPMQITLMKVKKDLQTKKVKANTIMPVKSLLKQITIFYQDKVHQGKDNPMLKEQDMGTFVYKQFINTYGLGKFAVTKFVKFVTSLKRHIHVHRVNNFAKMVGILNDGENYSLAEARQYLHGLEFFMYHSTAGMHYPNPDHQKTHYIPFSKALEYLRFYTEQHGQEDDIYSFRKELEKLRIVDPSKVNTSGLIDLDIFLEKMVARHKILVSKAEQALLAGFNSADFLKEKKVRFADFLVLYKAIEGDRSEDKKIEEMFVSYCDMVDGDHLAVSKEKFLTMIFDLNIFSKHKLNTYLGVRDEFEFEKKFEVFKGKWEEEAENLTANIEKGQSSLPHEIITKWKTILELIGQDLDKSEAYIRKAAMIRHKILSTDILNNVSQIS